MISVSELQLPKSVRVLRDDDHNSDNFGFYGYAIVNDLGMVVATDEGYSNSTAATIAAFRRIAEDDL